MEHVDKKVKLKALDSNKENARKEAKLDFQQMMLSRGGIIEFADALPPPPLRETGSSGSIPSYSNHFQDERAKKPWEKRITELLAENFEYKVKIETTKTSTVLAKTEGDIPSLCLHSSFFVEGVRIGWPFPVIMPPQRQMALHLIKALKNRRHVVLESPTGTGKSAAILCSTLAWQRYHKMTHSGPDAPQTPRIIYCSRTHSQVTQMISSLRKTPYRPRMAVLGSRERLCIHKKISSRGPPGVEPTNNVNVNQECRTRVGNTELMRKRMWQSNSDHYDDDNPPEGLELDSAEAPQVAEEGQDWIDTGAKDKDKACCPHYRQLSTARTASLAYETFVPQNPNCCARGGEHTKLGSHDIEDLVEFAQDPYVKRGVAVYRDKSKGSFGMQIGKFGNATRVTEIYNDGAIAEEGSVRLQDEILSLNGQDTRGQPIDQVANIMRSTEDPLLLDVTSNSILSANDDSGYSQHSPCPYFLSRALAKHAELIFCPYNYVLDPSIRKSLDIDLEGAIVVLDEAHNVENTLRESGSGKFGEIQLCEIVAMLVHFSSASKTHRNTVDTDGEKKDISELAHALLLFVEQLITFLMEAKTRFEQSPGKSGAKSVIAEWERFHTPDNTEFEMTYDGPNGRGLGGKTIGCKTFFHKLSLSQEKMEGLQRFTEGLDSHVRAQEEWAQTKYLTLLDNLNELMMRFAYAVEKPEYYFVASVVKANGSLEFAAGMASGGLRSQRDNGLKRSPKKMPSISRNGTVDRCFHPECRKATGGPHFHQGGIRHGTYCNGNEQPWEAVLVLELLTPAKFMNALAEKCHTVVLASGSLSPISSLCGELGLTGNAYDAETKPAIAKKRAGDVTDKKDEEPKKPRLQVQPKPLEADHVIDLEKQLLAVSIGHFDDGSPMTMTYAHYSKSDFITKLGGAIASVIEAVPTGGVLVFVPSYALLRKCVKQWNPYTSSRGGWGADNYIDSDGRMIWDRFEASKGKVIVEPTGSQTKFEEARDEYADTIRETGKCILLAVFRGKMSEGISFNDANARAVICVGIPFPMKSMTVKAKIDFNTEQRLLNKRTDVLPGNEWYSQQAYRAIAQALGRCIRHAADYGSVILMDSRHCDDGEPVEGICRAHRQLPKWMRHHVRNLSKRNIGDSFGNSIAGSWSGLRSEMTSFFKQAPIRSQLVLKQQHSQLKKARDRERAAQECKNNQKPDDWPLTQHRSSQMTRSKPNEVGGAPTSAPITPTQRTPA